MTDVQYMDYLIARMQPHLTLDLAPPNWQRLAKQFKKTNIPGFGCCYPASEVLYFLLGKKLGYKPCNARSSTRRGDTHWFLRHPDGRIADPTSAQFESDPFDYSKGRNCGFLTGDKLSKRGMILLERLKAEDANARY